MDLNFIFDIYVVILLVMFFRRILIYILFIIIIVFYVLVGGKVDFMSRVTRFSYVDWVYIVLYSLVLIEYSFLLWFFIGVIERNVGVVGIWVIVDWKSSDLWGIFGRVYCVFFGDLVMFVVLNMLYVCFVLCVLCFILLILF